ncbi:MAG TPA: kynureninase, partial [Jatrophihabitans sp.]|nr:kynureninase [Jatrophihabitans sp.]
MSSELSAERQPPAVDFAALAAELDARDDLAALRERFTLPDGVTYLDGNSLGALPSGVLPALAGVVGQEWGQDLITSWNVHDWWSLPARVGDRIGRLIGAAPGQVLCGDSTSVQLFQALVAACRLRPGRTRILTDGGSFPTDQYLADSVAGLLGMTVTRLHPSELAQVLSDDVAVVSFSQVDYRTGELFDLAAVTEQVHASGALMLWDLCHSAGAVPVELDRAQVDLAVGCSYKYLNGGPGAPGYIYLAARHIQAVQLPLTGWQGHRTPFRLQSGYEPAPSIERARIGTPPLLSMAALDAALDAFEGVSMAAVRAKSLQLTQLVIDFAQHRLAGHGVTVVTPAEPARRGSQVSLRMPGAYEVCQALIERGVIGDFRE